MLRRLEDRIRYLCRKALTARDDELGSLFWELRSALHEDANRLRQLAALNLAIAKEALLSVSVKIVGPSRPLPFSRSPTKVLKAGCSWLAHRFNFQ
jgi:hypothetical protein